MRFLLLGCIVVSFLSSCELFRGTPRVASYNSNRNTSTYSFPSSNNTDDAEDYADDYDDFDTTTIQDFGMKEQYNIAVLLPFRLDESYLDKNERKKVVPYRSLISTELYQGMLLGLEDLKQTGLKLEVTVFDTENDPGTVASILTDPDFRAADLILGPLTRNSLSQVAEYGSQNQTYVVSPLVELEVEKQMPYLFHASPSKLTQMRVLADFVLDKHKGKRVVTVREEGSDAQIDMVKAFRSHLTKISPQYRFKKLESKTTHITGDDFNLSLRVNQEADFYNDTTVVVVTSSNEGFVEDLARQLYASRENSPVILIGQATWVERFSAIRYEYLDALNFHYLSNVWRDKYATGNDFMLNERYETKYGQVPSAFVYKGYDMMVHAGQLLDKYGLTFTEYISELNLEKFYKRLDLVPHYNSEMDLRQGKFDYIENRYTNILKYSNYEFTKVY